MLLLSSCSSHPPLAHETAHSGSVAFQIVCIIHGDGSYLFHDSNGKSYRADEEALTGARRVAERNSQAEVFIFHEKRRKHTLLLFPRHDGEFYYYRNGQLLAQESYWRDPDSLRFSPEVKLYNQFRAEGPAGQTRMFLYFGHEIPEFGGKGYDASHRERSFTIQDVAAGMQALSTDSTRFDLAVLSTCFNGTPYTISELSPVARYVVASPANLHLSYLDLQPLEALDVGMSDRNVSTFARNYARQSFERLSKDVETEITVAVYNVDSVRDFISSVDSLYSRDLSAAAAAAPASVERCDCAEDSEFVRPTMSQGVDVLFRPARFGRAAHKKSHSGWECLKILKGAQAE